jgi:cell division control protein 6
MTRQLTDFLQNYIKKGSLFKDKKALQSNYKPKAVPYRGDQINQVAAILAPILRMEKPSNLFIYGKTGTGKTLVTKHVTENIRGIAKENKINLKIFYLNCKLKRVADTEYRLIAQLAREFGEEVPATGLPTDEIYKIFLNKLEEEKMILLIILDEIDQLVHKTGDEILYNLTRLNSELKESEISIIGISNDLLFTDNIDPRVKSSLSEEEIVFPPYNAIQLQKILKQRSKLAFHEKIIKEGVIEKCAAYAAREHGDARRALELLRVSGELAERKGDTRIEVKYIDQAEEKIERDRVVDIVATQPKQFKITLHSIVTVCSNNTNQSIFTGDVYNTYKETCSQCGITPLTQRRLSDIIAELDMLGIINAKVISKGRYGRTREISLAIPEGNITQITTILKNSLSL